MVGGVCGAGAPRFTVCGCRVFGGVWPLVLRLWVWLVLRAAKKSSSGSGGLIVIVGIAVGGVAVVVFLGGFLYYRARTGMGLPAAAVVPARVSPTRAL